MGKRSSFKRRPNDDYPTPYEAVPPLIPFIPDVEYFVEPCAGEGMLVRHLESFGRCCVRTAEITKGTDCMDWTAASLLHPYNEPVACISNPPWAREILHPMIVHLQRLAPTWLLFDADWAYTKKAIPYLDQCSHIVAVGRLKWIPDSKHTGKDNCAWYRFFWDHTGGPKFYPKQIVGKE